MAHSRSSGSLSRASPSPWAWGPSPAPLEQREPGLWTAGSCPRQGALGPQVTRGCPAAPPGLPRGRAAEAAEWLTCSPRTAQGPQLWTALRGASALHPPRPSRLCGFPDVGPLPEPPSGTRAGPEQPLGICGTSVPRAQGAAGTCGSWFRSRPARACSCAQTMGRPRSGALGPAGHSGPFLQPQGGRGAVGLQVLGREGDWGGQGVGETHAAESAGPHLCGALGLLPPAAAALRGLPPRAWPGRGQSFCPVASVSPSRGAHASATAPRPGGRGVVSE